MGYRAIGWAWTVSGLSPAERFILIALADSASNQDGTCWPGLDMVGRMTGYSRRTVISTISSLADRQLITVIERRDQQGRQQSNVYRLSLQSEIPSYRGAAVAPRPENGDTTPLESVALRVQLAHQPSAIDDAALKGIEPSEEEPSEELETTTAAAVQSSVLVSALARGHEAVIGMLTPYVGQQFAQFATEYPLFPVAWIPDAFARAGDNNVRKWSYVKAILEGWAAKGRDDAPAKRQEREAVPLSAYPKHQCGPICRKTGCVLQEARP